MSSPIWLTTGESMPFLPELLAAFNRADQIHLAVAFIKLSGLELLWAAFEDALCRGTRLEILTGDYLGLTDPAAMRRLLHLQAYSRRLPAGTCPEPSIRVFESRGQSFHPKAYLFVTLDARDPSEIAEGTAFVGSSNLSESALTSGIEWNLRVDKQENPARFVTLFNAFDELFAHPRTRPLTAEWIEAYQERRRPSGGSFRREGEAFEPESLAVPEPTTVQLEALRQLERTRQEGARRGLVVLATGLGKTWLSAFDARQACDPLRPRVLFVAHREEILSQAEATYLRIFPEASTGWYMGAEQETRSDLLFASIQTLGRREHLKRFASDAFDYIVVDEFHHAAAASYRHLLSHFKPGFLLGLTATPDRTDQADILSLCDGNLVCEVDLRQGIERRLLAPFVYFGIQDKHVDYARIGWRQGRFDGADLDVQVGTLQRAEHVLAEWREKHQDRTLAFCVSKHHAEFMADYFTRQGVASAAVHSTSAVRRDQALAELASGRLQVIFSVDLFNEGVDVPAIDTVMLLRPTESRILFLQQLGRGLRKAEDRPDKRLHVLDFLGNHKAFLNRPQALFGISSTRQGIQSFVRQLDQRALPLPPGCELRYDLEVLDFFREWSQTPKTSQVLDLYFQLADALGSRPSAREMYQAGGDDTMKAARREWGSWFELGAAEGALSEPEQACLRVYRDFFAEIETTAMTKSYKMVTLQALLELDGFRRPPTLDRLALQAFDVLRRRTSLRADLLGLKDIPWAGAITRVEELNPVQRQDWARYWRKNPIAAWCGSKGQSQAPWFGLDGQAFIFLPGLPQELVEPFHELVQELVDYKLFRYAPTFEYIHARPQAEGRMYDDWREWLAAQQGLRCVPLFAVGKDTPLQVETRTQAGSGHRLLCRHPEMEQAIIETVEDGLKSLSWTGLLFIVGWGQMPDFRPLHVSYTERMGRKQAVSENIRDIRHNRDKFARWGDNFKYRIGDLSQALFQNVPGKDANGLEKWIPLLFSCIDPPRLKEPVQLLILPWHKGQTAPSGEPCLLPELKRKLLKRMAEDSNQLIV